MALFKTPVGINGLLDLLDREREAVLGADFERLQRMSDEKERLFASVLPTIKDPKRLRLLKEKAHRNRELLEAAGKGIRSAADLLRTVRQPNRPHSTYSQSGKRSQMPTENPTLQRRA